MLRRGRGGGGKGGGGGGGAGGGGREGKMREGREADIGVRGSGGGAPERKDRERGGEGGGGGGVEEQRRGEGSLGVREGRGRGRARGGRGGEGGGAGGPRGNQDRCRQMTARPRRYRSSGEEGRRKRRREGRKCPYPHEKRRLGHHDRNPAPALKPTRISDQAQSTLRRNSHERERREGNRGGATGISPRFQRIKERQKSAGGGESGGRRGGVAEGQGGMGEEGVCWEVLLRSSHPQWSREVREGKSKRGKEKKVVGGEGR